MSDRLRGVEQVGQPDAPTLIPIDEAKPLVARAEVELEAIVRDLATMRSFRDDLGFAFECRCPTVDHAETCPYRRSREWVAAHPGTEAHR